MTDSATEYSTAPSWDQVFFETVGFYPPRNEAQPAAPAAEPQPTPADPGQGQGQTPSGGDADSKGSDGGFNWGLFPDVPEEQRTLLEPHLKKVQAHVTKLEQQLSANPDAERVQSLVSFEEAFNSDPRGVWLEMAKRMQESGQIHADLDLDAVAAYASGQEPPDPEAGQPQQQPPPAQQVPGQEQQPVDPRIEQLEKQLEEMQGTLTQEQQARQERVQNELLDRQFAEMKRQLGEAGVAEEDLSNEFLAAQIIAHQGNTQQAIDSVRGFRESTLNGLAAKAKEKGQKGEVDMPRGVPGGPEARSKDGWKSADQGAKAFLRRSNEATAQE